MKRWGIVKLSLNPSQLHSTRNPNKTSTSHNHHRHHQHQSSMASRYRSISKPASTIFKSIVNPSPKPTSIPSLTPLSPPTSSLIRSFRRIGCVQSLLPLHSAVSSARLTSCLGIDSKGSRSLSQGMLSSANPGV